MESRRLLAETGFAPQGREQWRALAEKALNGASFDAALTSRTDDGIVVQPLYERAAARPCPRVDPASRWAVVQRVDDPDPERANAQALDDIAYRQAKKPFHAPSTAFPWARSICAPTSIR